MNGNHARQGVFKPHETFRDDFSYRNSPEAIRRFPLPFPEDSYMYSVNIEPHLPGPPGSVVEFAFDIDDNQNINFFHGFCFMLWLYGNAVITLPSDRR